MRPTPRTQPYRAGTPRAPGMALEMMLRGRQPGVPVNGADFARQRLADSRPSLRAQVDPRPSLRALVQQRIQPQASADIRGVFGGQEGMAIDRFPPQPSMMPTVPMHPSADPQARELHQLVLAALQMQRRAQRRPRSNGGVAAPPYAHI